jgi:hypothetical protein
MTEREELFAKARPFLRALLGVFLVSLALLLPVNAQLNQNCVVSVLNRTVSVNPDGSWILPNVPANFGPVRARATCVQNGVTTFGQSDLFTMSANQTVNLPHINFGTPTPIPISVSISSTATLLQTVGATAQLSVTATFAGGTAGNITPAASGTVYNVSNPAIATVSTGGLVTAVSSGTVVIQSVNEGRQGIINIQVVLAGASHGGIPDSWAIAHGLDPNDPAMPFEDPDHDGLNNLQEFQNGTDPHNPDTDGDGLTDGQEVLMYHTNPLLFSTDGSGIPDGLEVQEGTLGETLAQKLAKAVSSLTVTPAHFVLAVNTIEGIASQQLDVKGLLADLKTIIDLTSTTEGTTYSSSDVTICNFGAPDGNIFAGNNGSCTITVTNGSLSAQVMGVVNTFAPTDLSFIAIPGFANGVAVNGNYAYVAAGASGLQVVNVSDRTNPSIVASLQLAGNSDNITLLGTRVYIAGGSAGMQVVDISNPLSPVLLGTFNTGGTALDVTVTGTTAYIANQTSLVIADVTSPSSIVQLGTLPLTGLIQGIAVDPLRNLAVVAAGTSGIYVVDVSNPSSPVRLGSVVTGDARNAALKGNFAFVADFLNSTTSVDLTIPATPVVLSHITDPNLGGFLQDIKLSGNFALAADVKFVNGIPITDISDPTNLIARAILNFTQRDDNGMGIAADGSYVYLTTEHSALDKFGTVGDSRLYIGQYLAIVDNKGIPPTAVITAPITGAAVVQGQTLPIIVNASDDIAVAAVNFLVNGQVVFTSTASPYQYNFSVPQTLGPLTIGANAVDFGGNVGTAQNVTVNVIPDPGTTVTGTVVDTNHNPVAGATVTTAGGLSGTTQADGTFSIPDVPTVSITIVVNATETVNGVSLRGTSIAVPPVRAGTTNVGTIIISQAIFETNLGTLVATCDDCFVPVTLPFPFTYFGRTYNTLSVNNNGNLTLNSGDSTYTPTIGGFAAQPRIGAFWDDLIACAGLPNDGLYVNTTIPGEVVITWNHQQIYYCVGDDTIQAILYSDGRIQFAYNGITTIAGSTSNGVIVGITPGGNLPVTQVDYVSNPSFTINAQASVLEQFVSGVNAFNLDGDFILYTPNGAGGYTVQLVPAAPVSTTPTTNARALARPTIARRPNAIAAGAGLTVQGTAYDAQGNPLPGVQISLTCSLAMSYSGLATTDANGHYTISGVPYGGISVTALQGSTQVSIGGAVVQSGSSITIDLHPLVNKPKS